jgi:hypothetical protein
MLNILHKGNQISAPIDQSGFNGDAAHDAALLSTLIAGRVVAMTSTGTIALADGDETKGAVPLGFLIVDAAGPFFENIPALASGQAAVTFGNCVVVTDQIDPAITFAAGDKVYVGTGAKKGLLTNVAAANARAIGIAMSAASAAAPALKVAVEG